MKLPVTEIQNSLDAIWPFDFSVEDDGERIGIYSVDDELIGTSIFDLNIMGDLEPGQDTYWGPFGLTYVDPVIGVWSYRQNVDFAPTLALIVYILTLNQFSRELLVEKGLPPHEWERIT